MTAAFRGKNKSYMGNYTRTPEEEKALMWCFKNNICITPRQTKYGEKLWYIDIEKGIFFDSSIPQGFGVGSSGALVAAVYDTYCTNKIVSSSDIPNKSILKLKNIFGQLESYFHGTSSGLDPLICYLNLPILIKSKENLGTVGIPSTVNGKGAIFLMNTGETGETQPLVQHFLERCKEDGFRKMLKNKFKNIESHLVILDNLFKTFKNSLSEFDNEHGFANSRARLRMATLYQVAAANSGIVVGTGNKVEDFGVGFYTKYGDGGVDISPIADCTKTQVWELGKYLGVSEEIINSQPTDGLWDDGRNDVQQLGMSYEDLEKAMENKDDPNYQKYLKIREKNLHKMNPIPVCKFNE